MDLVKVKIHGSGYMAHTSMALWWVWIYGLQPQAHVAVVGVWPFTAMDLVLSLQSQVHGGCGAKKAAH